MSGENSLTVADVAKLRGIGRVAAYRWLHRNAARYLLRDGRRVVIQKKDYARLMGAPLDDRVSELESRMAESERRLDAHARALSSLHAL